MHFLTEAVSAALLIWFGLLFLLVMVRALSGGINVVGVLSNAAQDAGTRSDPERVVAMAVFPVVLAAYVLRALEGAVPGATGAPQMPDIPDALLNLLVGSNGVYLAGKIARR